MEYIEENEVTETIETPQNEQQMQTITENETNFNLLEKMLRLVVRYGVWNIIKAIMLLVAFIMVMWTATHMDTIFEKVIMKQETKEVLYHESVMKHRTEIKPKIDLILKNTLDEMDADRVFVIEMHNGTNSLSGLPFVYCEMTYETCKKGIMRVDDEYGSVVLSRYTLPYYMSENSVYCGTVDELEEIDPKLAHRMRDNGTYYICVANMYSLNEYIGYVGIGYSEGSQPADKEKLKDAVFKMSQRVSTLLDPSQIPNIYEE